MLLLVPQSRELHGREKLLARCLWPECWTSAQEERILLVTELMEAGDLWHALARDQGGDTRELGWYNRCAA